MSSQTWLYFAWIHVRMWLTSIGIFLRKKFPRHCYLESILQVLIDNAHQPVLSHQKFKLGLMTKYTKNGTIKSKEYLIGSFCDNNTLQLDETEF